MTRTQILLEPWHQRFLAGLARKSGLSVSAIIRQWVEEKAAASKSGRLKDPIFGIVGMVRDSAGDVSENTDAYLYGAKRRAKP